MADISEKAQEIKKLVDDGKYFTISRPRQYGKTTTLTALTQTLADQYDVISIDFQDVTSADFANESEFTKGLAQLLCDTSDSMEIPVPDACYDRFQKLAGTGEKAKLNDIFRIFDRWCKENAKPVVMIIDEADTAANHQVFWDFLGKLRSGYIKRETNANYRTFQSVILAGVTDVRHLNPQDDIKENSQWNIDADFTVDMSLSEDGIRGMLNEYEEEHHTGMDTEAIAKTIREYTSGYPFLASRICQLADEEVTKTMNPAEAWTGKGINRAVSLLLSENNTLFYSLTEKLNSYPELKAAIRRILMEGTKLTYNAQQSAIVKMQMHGLIRNDHNIVRIANRIFEKMLYNLFLSDDELNNCVAKN
ncbi:AAA family ATPase [Succinimonas sp.]|uniref:AAA-like domain-containing protein n=1 Tax=Succinimonas sp. TaxID=1936151 RepID=UPI003869EE0B